MTGTVSLLPGRAYTPEHPLLRVMVLLLRGRGWTVAPVTWGPLPDDPDAWPDHVRGLVAAEWERTPPSLVVAKSLGTHALPLVVERGLPGVWLTPRLDDVAQQRALATAGSPQLVIGGTVDPFWDRAATMNASPSVEVLELEGLDHALELPGAPHRSLAALGEVLRRVERFLTTF